jgi:hypothetical protein
VALEDKTGPRDILFYVSSLKESGPIKLQRLRCTRLIKILKTINLKNSEFKWRTVQEVRT